MRLALDMGLNFDFSTYANGTGPCMTPDEAFVRRRLYWTIYCHDKLAASYTGRICTFLVSSSGHCIVSDGSHSAIPSAFISFTLRGPVELEVASRFYIP